MRIVQAYQIDIGKDVEYRNLVLKKFIYIQRYRVLRMDIILPGTSSKHNDAGCKT